MYIRDCIVKENRQIAGSYYRLLLGIPAEMLVAQPGQFCMLETKKDGYSLRRPLSIHALNKEKGEMAFYYEVKGSGTRSLAKFMEGEKISVQGPLGKGFSLVEAKKIAVIGGGMGLAPLQYLLERLKERNEVHFLAGGRGKAALEILGDFSLEGLDLRLSTDDGSLGRRGNVVEMLVDLLEEESIDKIYACGPEGMLWALGHVARERGIACDLSLESHMACGVKACMGCSIVTMLGMKKVCHDGPVFAADTLCLD